jgi:hypothetical protein
MFELTGVGNPVIDGVFCGKKFNMKSDKNGKLIFSKKEKIFDWYEKLHG